MEFDPDAPRIRILDSDILESLRSYSAYCKKDIFGTVEFDLWKARACSSGTVIKRFGSWHDACVQAGLNGGRKRAYSPEELVENLRNVWIELGRRPGKRSLSDFGRKISERPYNNVWGSVERACRRLSDYEKGKITEGELLERVEDSQRRTVPLGIRWKILKRDSYKCVICGKSPANSGIELHIDHIVPVSRGGGNEEGNLRTLCDECNLGRSNQYD